MSEHTILDEATLAGLPSRVQTVARNTLTASPAMQAAAQKAAAKVGIKHPLASAVEPAKPKKWKGKRKRGGRARTAEARAAFWAEVKAARHATAALLCDRWPAAFCVPRVPLAIGIYNQVLNAAGDDFEPIALRRFFHWWVRKIDYLDAVAHGEPRRNLDGSLTDVPDEQTRLSAAKFKIAIEAHRAATGDVIEEGAITAQVKTPKPTH